MTDKVVKKNKVKNVPTQLPSRRSSRIADNKMPVGIYSDDNQKEPFVKKKEYPSASSNFESCKFSIKNEISESSTENFPCEKCDKVFKFNNSLVKHVNSIHDKTMFTCNVCFSSFTYLANLKRHSDKSHNGSIVKYHCKECSQSFTYQHNLNTHLVKFHDHEM
jgi:uncharacterized C2H2 Zn-finger protein